MPPFDPDSQSAASFKQPVTLRFGDLEPEIARRRRAEDTPASIVRRDLARYYKALDDAARDVWLQPKEAEALVIVLNYGRFDVAAYRYLWAEVAQRFEAEAATPDDFPLLPDGVDGPAFAAKLRAFHPMALLALVDRYEQYVALGGDTDTLTTINWELMGRVGLVSRDTAARAAAEQSARVEATRKAYAESRAKRASTSSVGQAPST